CMASDTAIAKPDPLPPGAAEPRRSLKRFGGSRLGGLILALNLLSLLILFVGALLLNEWSRGLIQARQETLLAQAELLANVLAAAQLGVTRFDASLAGIGGCPHAPGASGNVNTEELVHMFACMDVQTGVSLEPLLAIVRSLPGLVQRDLSNALLQAGPRLALHAPPAWLAERFPAGA
ncbi:MAG: sensor N-terminal transmembrane domain-containing protein, partial [Campylobacterales bacterium]|nr:sensor N-terminal transmembrane domain-containing protein [Campylobacterales bacterium]